MAASSTPPARVILLVDLDGFYAQVEANRVGVPPTTPLGVQQWEHYIAANYAAKDAGIARVSGVAAVKELIPDIVSVHVALRDAHGKRLPRDVVPCRREHKTDLGPYRRASARILAMLQAAAGGAQFVERASIDEAFLDLTGAVQRAMAQEPSLAALAAGCVCQARHPAARGARMAELLDMARTEPGQTQAAYSGSITVPELQAAAVLPAACVVAGSAADHELTGAPLPGVCEHLPACAQGQALLVGSLFARAIQMRVARQLRYTVSVGVAMNKVLAKHFVKRGKPARIGCCPADSSAVQALLQHAELGSIRGLGGKLGRTLTAKFNVTTVGQVLGVPLPELTRAVGRDTAVWLQRLCSGEDSDPVVPRDGYKGMMAAKSMPATQCASRAAVLRWLQMLAHELVNRLAEDGRRPSTFSVLYRHASTHASSTGQPVWGTMRSKSCPLPSLPPELFSCATSAAQSESLPDELSDEVEAKAADTLMRTAERLLSKVPDTELFPATGVGLSFGGFPMGVGSLGQSTLLDSWRNAAPADSAAAQVSLLADLTASSASPAPGSPSSTGSGDVLECAPEVGSAPPDAAQRAASSMAPKSGDSPSLWPCSACTLKNNRTTLLCAACGTAKFQSTKPGTKRPASRSIASYFGSK